MNTDPCAHNTNAGTYVSLSSMRLQNGPAAQNMVLTLLYVQPRKKLRALVELIPLRLCGGESQIRNWFRTTLYLAEDILLDTLFIVTFIHRIHFSKITVEPWHSHAEAIITSQRLLSIETSSSLCTASNRKSLQQTKFLKKTAHFIQIAHKS